MANSKEIKWQTYENNGVYIPDDYQPQGYIIEGAENRLVVENMLWDLSMYVGTDKIKDKRLIKNFNADLKSYGKTNKTIDDFMPILEIMKAKRDQAKIDKANRSKEQKEQDKAAAEKIKNELKEKYGYVTIDGTKMELTSYMTEGSRVFIGRGSHPKFGCWLPKVQPEEITINTSDLKNPPAAPKGHHWGAVVCNPNTFMAWWYNLDKVNEKKFATVGQGSEQGMENNKEKFDIVRNLASNWEMVGKAIDKTLKEATDETEIQIGIVAYLIRNLGIRMGNDQRSKSDEFATNVVGASTLRKNNIIWNKDGSVRFHFLGKDSVEYDNTFNLDPAFKELLLARWNAAEGDGTKKWDDMKGDGSLFPKAKSTLINDYFGKILPGLTAKKFRTAYGSAILAKALRNLKIEEGEKLTSIKIKLDEAQLLVAKKLNHQRGINKKSLENAETKGAEKTNVLNTKIKEFKKQLKAETSETKREKLREKLEKAEEKLSFEERKLSFKKNTADSSISTSKKSYSDPRVLLSFCLDNDIEVKKVYTKSLLNNFIWALKDLDKDFYKEYPEIN